MKRPGPGQLRIANCGSRIADCELRIADLRQRKPGRRRVRCSSIRNPQSAIRNVQLPRGGFSLVEASIGTLIVGILIAVSLTVLGAARAGQLKIADRVRGQQLALDLMNEILRKEYLEPDDPPLFGPEGTEATKGRVAFDDVDDYAGWTQSPPQTRSGVPLSDFDGWTRSVAVEWADPNDLSRTSVTPTDIKRITVTVQHGTVPVARTVAIRTAGWAQTVPQNQDATGNRAPNAAVWADQAVQKAGVPVSLDGRNSADPDGDTLSYVWTFGDTATAAGSTASHTYASAGTFTVTLTVRDGRGGVGTDRLAVTIKP